jgi:hypothetical protein
VNRRKPRVQTPVVSRYPAPTPVEDFVLLFLPPCGPHLTPLVTGSLESDLLVSPLLGGPARHRPFAPTLHLHQRKSSRNLHLQYSAKSQSTPSCQSLITARSDHPLVLGRSGPQRYIPLISFPWKLVLKLEFISSRSPLFFFVHLLQCHQQPTESKFCGFYCACHLLKLKDRGPNMEVLSWDLHL